MLYFAKVVDLLLTAEGHCIGIEVHDFSSSEARTLSFLFSTLLTFSLTASGNEYSSFHHLQNKYGGFRDTN